MYNLDPLISARERNASMEDSPMQSSYSTWSTSLQIEGNFDGLQVLLACFPAPVLATYTFMITHACTQVQYSIKICFFATWVEVFCMFEQK
jgi:hypothetical protein